MKKICQLYIIPVLYLILIQTTIYGQAPEVTWTSIIGGEGADIAYDVYETSDGGFVMGGYTSNSGDFDMVMIKTDENGDVVWTKTYGLDAADEKANCMIETVDGGYMLAGSSSDATTTDLYMVKTDAEGNLEWSSIIGYDSVSETAQSIAQTLDGGYVMCGHYWASSTTGYDVLMVKTDSFGFLEWRQVHDFQPGKAEYSSCIIQTSDGNIAVTGKTQAFTTNYDDDSYILITNMGGGMLSLTNHGSAWPYYEGGNHILQTSDDGFLVSGYQNNDGLDNQWYIYKTGGSSGVSWEYTIGGVYHEKAYAATETTDEGFAVTGSYHDDTWNAFVTRFNFTGDTLWTKMWGLEDLSQHNYAIQQTSDGGYITVGSTETEENYFDIYLSKLAPETVGIDRGLAANVTPEFTIIPNPIVGHATIHFNFQQPLMVRISIYDLLGEEIVVLLDKTVQGGTQTIDFQTSDIHSGVYFCKFETPSGYSVKKISVVK